jgi:predicted nucleic acid binding AN1-type Zn finger protein
MYDTKVGTHCHFKGCHQKDFLPYTCKGCGQIHCGEHRRPDEHMCAAGAVPESRYVVLCDKCDMRIEITGEMSHDELLTKH